MVANIGLSAVATGTADVITATYSPAITLSDRRIVFLRVATPNTTTTPTFNPNSLGAQVIKGKAGATLKIGELTGDCILMYHTSGTYWELLNSTPFLDATSSIQTQLDNKVCAITFFQTSNQTIADSTSYFIAAVTSPATILANSSMIPVKAGTLIGVSLGGFNASTIGSNEAWTVKLWYNNGANSVTLTTNFTGGNANRNYFLDIDGLSTAINDGNCVVEFAAPILAANPGAFRPTATIYIRS